MKEKITAVPRMCADRKHA